MSGLQLNPVYVHAAACGLRGAQSELAAACGTHAQAIAAENPGLADEYFTAAELFAELARAHGQAYDAAVLAGVFAMRSLGLAARDPVRSLEYRDQAEALFDEVENACDTLALGVIAYALDKLADADPDDNRASDRLNRVIGMLPAGEAQRLREVVRSLKPEIHKEQQ